VSHAAPYRHFEDKRALLAAIAEEGFVRLSDQLKTAVGGAAPDAQLLAIASCYINFALSEPALAREMFSGLSIDRMAYPSLYGASKAAFGILLGVVTAQQAAGAVVQDDPEKLVVILWSMIHGLAMLLLENQMPMVTEDPDGVAEVTKQYVAAIYDGLRPR
jgi:AcrR family transcriptional regulator